MAKNKPIYVTQSFLPPRQEFDAYVDRIWDSGMLTNKGPLLVELEKKLTDYLDVSHFQFVTNGTLALQLAIDGLGITSGEIITTPFSYVATTSAILWQRCTPVFVDIDPETLNIDPSKIEASITPDTKAILAVHVFGNACDVDAIQNIANKHNLKVIYDAAHAFGATHKGKSLLDYGDVSIVSFHATKLFHTIEGGGIVCKDKDVSDRIDLAKRFGHQGDDHISLGINAKANEFQAAMGLANLPYISENIKKRQSISELYDSLLAGVNLERQTILQGRDNYNFAYYPVVFENENILHEVVRVLADESVYPRRYFYPSLNTLPYVQQPSSTPMSEDIATRILCLPLYPDLDAGDVERISRRISSVVESAKGED